MKRSCEFDSAQDNKKLKKTPQFRVGQRVKMKDEGYGIWRFGFVTQTKPLKVRHEHGTMAMSWDLVESLEIDLVLGFIGIGTLGSSIIQGLCQSLTGEDEYDDLRITKICCSPRSESKVAKLKTKYPNAIECCENNQEVANKVDVLFISVLPTQVSEVCNDLDVTNPKLVISCVAAHTIDQIQSYFKTTGPKTKVVKAIPIPAVAHQNGSTILFPKEEIVEKLFTRIGAVASPKEGQGLEVLQSYTCLMGYLYETMRVCQAWGKEQGISAEVLQNNISNCFSSIISDATERTNEENLFEQLIAEQTPGGINASALQQLKDQNHFDGLREALDHIIGRVRGTY